MATHANILTWKIPWTEESGRLQPMGLQKIWTWVSDLTTTSSLSKITFFFSYLCFSSTSFMLWIRKLGCFLLELQVPCVLFVSSYGETRKEVEGETFTLNYISATATALRPSISCSIARTYPTATPRSLGARNMSEKSRCSVRTTRLFHTLSSI